MFKVSVGILALGLLLGAQAFAHKHLPGYHSLVKCTEVYPTANNKPYRFNTRVFQNDANGADLILMVHKVKNASNYGTDEIETQVLKEHVHNTNYTTFWHEVGGAWDIILKDVQPYHSNKSILESRIRGREIQSTWMKCWDNFKSQD